MFPQRENKRMVWLHWFLLYFMCTILHIWLIAFSFVVYLVLKEKRSRLICNISAYLVVENFTSKCVCCNLSYLCWCDLLYVQDCQAKLTIGSIAMCCLLTHLNSANTLIKIVKDLLPSLAGTFGTTNSPFACVSNSLNKPTPLQLDVSLPSFQDIKWSLSRLLYLFNMQLERNVAT